jgi:hypothetical protein
VSGLREFYALAVVFGMAYGGVMPLYAVLARSYFSQNIMGTVLGAATMLSCLGMSFGRGPRRRGDRAGVSAGAAGPCASLTVYQ